ncbi:MAG: rhomboid family intramembrane serine protease, partial [Nitrospirae bacterium]
MIPFKDDNPTSTFPFITILIISANTLVFAYQFLHPEDAQEMIFLFGAIPHYILTFETTQPIHPLLSIFTSMFMHANLVHVGGNMLYLWIFGDNVEDKLGHLRFLLFYLLCGYIAAYSHAITTPYSLVPMIGASGAISGVLGGYMLLFPRARVYTLLFFLFFVQIVEIPAFIVIGLWFLFQVLNGLMSIGYQRGVAWFAHVGGFISGMILI